MREQEEARPKITTDGVRRKICCFGMGWWGCAKREQLSLRWRLSELLSEHLMAMFRACALLRCQLFRMILYASDWKLFFSHVYVGHLGSYRWFACWCRCPEDVHPCHIRPSMGVLTCR